MGKSNTGICFWFVSMMFTGIGLLKDTYGLPKMLVILGAVGFLYSAWFFMDGLLSIIRPAPKVELSSDTEETTIIQ